MLRLTLKFHSAWMALYPRTFREEFGDELQGVFAAMLLEASRNSVWIFLWVVFREFIELPVNALDQHLGSWRKSGYMLQSWRALTKPLWRILRNTVLLETGVLFALYVFARRGKWDSGEKGYALFFAGIFILIMAGTGFSGGRRSGYALGLGINRFPDPNYGRLLQLVYQQTQFDLNGEAWANLANLLSAYSGPISLALSGVCTILLGIKVGN